MKKSIKKEALEIAGGLYSMNAKGAKWYAFCHDEKEITYGMFVWASEGIPSVEKFDGYVILATGELIEL